MGFADFKLPRDKKADYLLLPFVLIVFYVSEALTKAAYFLKIGFYNYSAIIKAAFILFALLFLIYKKKYSWLWFFFGLFAVFLIGQAAFNDWTFNKEIFFSNLIYFGRYLLIFFIVLVFNPYKKTFSSSAFLTFEIILIFNSLLVIAGAVFGIELFRTYPYRYGYNGFFMTPTVISYFNAIGLIYYFRKILNGKKSYLPLVIIVAASLFTGTKGILFFMLFSFIHLFFLKKLYKKPMVWGAGVFVILMAFIYRNPLTGFLASRYDTLYKVYQKDGWLSALTSYRDRNLLEVIELLKSHGWSAVNWVFGGLDFELYRVEFDFLDVILFFGLLGGFIYFRQYFTKVIRFTKLDNFSKIQLILLLATGALSGTFFNSGPMALYLVMVINYLYIAPKWR